jgi:hypothetical protein
MIKTPQLYSQPSFFKGVARVFDLFGRLDSYPTYKNAAEADREAIASDWQVVGSDLYQVISSK